MRLFLHDGKGCALEGTERRCYSPDVQPLLQSLLATLADLDFAYERERDRICSSTKDPRLQAQALRKLELGHQDRREPYVRDLTLLQERLMLSFSRGQEQIAARVEGGRLGRLVENTSRWMPPGTSKAGDPR